VASRPYPLRPGLNGSVTIRSVDDSAVAGTFTADFGPDRALEGTFDAAVCAE
jgi:hypothetical protein